MKTLKIVTTVAIICISAHLPICTSAQVANGTGAGNCLIYNGTSNYVDCGNNSALSVGGSPSNSFSISAWIKTSQLEGKIISKCRQTGTDPYAAVYPNMEYIFDITNGYLDFRRYRDETAQTGGFESIVDNTILINDDKWHFVAFVNENASSHKLYVDGVNVVTSTVTWIFNTQNNQNVFIGYLQNYVWGGMGYPYFSGQIDELSIWNRALTETEIRDNMCKKLNGNESGLVGYWRFDEGSGGTAYDASGNGNNGTLY